VVRRERQVQGSKVLFKLLHGARAMFYAKRTLTHVPIDPKDCAEAILFVGGPKAPVTTGHLIPVDGGLTEAYLR
jgi:NAD(P)-dependent dehydrogenase (short-subunit alcohol dehydrogenase family)